MNSQTISTQIPVNTRTVGKPSGIYILYLEDYVYTFMKKLLAEKAETNGDACEISLFGKRFDEEGRSLLVISGAAQNPFPEEKGRQSFPSCSFLGNAKIETNKDFRLRLEVSIKNTNIVLDDFYIYYDQNDEMQNYLIDWNLNHKSAQNEDETQAIRQKKANVRAESDDAVRYGRLAQAYNREEARVSFIWNVMNILCLGLVLCIMVYGIISINNYQKMKNMEKTIDYCLALITDNIQLSGVKPVNSGAAATEDGQYERFVGQTGETAEAAAQPASEEASSAELQPAPQETATVTASSAEPQPAPQDTATDTVSPAESQPTSQDTDTATASSTEPQTAQQDTATATASSAASQQQSEPEVTQALVQLSPETPQEEAQPPVPQYYIIQQGDTLRTISYDVYGTYNMVDEICQWNKIENPDNILYGQRLLLP